MDTQNTPETPQTPPNTPETTAPATPKSNASMLEQILQTAQKGNTTESGVTPATPPTGGDTPVIGGGTPTPPAPKLRDPMKASTALKFIGSVLLVGVIFFGSFLAYIVFNPDQATFFVNVFGIDPADLQSLLKNLINGSFGTIVFVLSIVWIMSLFRAIWTPKEQKRKRLMGWLTAAIVGILLFSILAFWAFLFSIINKTDYTNPGGNVTIYENDMFVYEGASPRSRLGNTKNIIGPIALRYNLTTNAKFVENRNLMDIQSFRIDFDGARCANGDGVVQGTDPKSELGIVCIFDQIKTYNIRGIYKAKNRLGEMIDVTIPLNPVQISGVIDITTNTNQSGEKIITYNASKIKSLGNPRWKYLSEGANISEKDQASITEVIHSTPSIICLKVFGADCDRFFIVQTKDTDIVQGAIAFNQDAVNPLGVTMSLSGLSLDTNEVIGIDWITDNDTRMCSGNRNSCDYAFPSYGKKNIKAVIKLADTTSRDIQGSIILYQPILLSKHAELLDANGVVMNTVETYDPSLSAYVLKNLVLPQRITLDAQNVVAENPGYTLKDIVWRITDGKNVLEEKIGPKVTFDIPKSIRYVIEARYSFAQNTATTEADMQMARDIFILDLDRKGLQPYANVISSSDYVPAKVTVDASASHSANGEIKKFLFDFGEGRPVAEGDAIQTYQYTTAGEKKITITIINDQNISATITKYIILKDTPKNVGFSTSMSPAVVGMPVDFIGDHSTGQIEEYIWNFGDNTPIARGYDVTHTYAKAGTYNVILTIRYIDGTEKSTTQQVVVTTSLE